MNTQHTPGPWHCKELIGCTERGWSVFYTHSHGTKRVDMYNGEFSEANARLIAVAPEMLALLQGFVRDAERLGDAPDSDPDKLRACKAFLHMVWMGGSAAIAKATGGDNA